MGSLPDGQPPRDPSSKQGGGLFALAGLGMEFAIAVGLFALGGWALDRRWQSSPWLLVVGIVIGFAVGLYMLIKAGKQAFKD